jgi:hypothetical protein
MFGFAPFGKLAFGQLPRNGLLLTAAAGSFAVSTGGAANFTVAGIWTSTDVPTSSWLGQPLSENIWTPSGVVTSTWMPE